MIVVSCVPTATRIVSACDGVNMATVMATMAALILKELKSIIELSSEAGRMPATMPAGTIEGAAQCLKQLLASPRRQLAS
ncbi:hypothetical protein J2R91_003374 [Bradyrhizobium japonicum]|nr:hypothetical protein [Bradyrhizobium japonicum]